MGVQKPVTCRGWQGRCENPPAALYVMAYEGARMYPTEYRLCKDCGDNLGRFVAEIMQRAPSDIVLWRCDPLL